jgi:hypothetical protein
MCRRPWFAFALATTTALVTASAGAQDDDEYTKAKVGKFRVQENGYFNRLVYDGTLIGTQINERYIVRADAPNLFGLLTPWESLALVGSHGRWDPTHEPLTYYHRTGPVGAMFYHLRTRKGGADATAPVGVVGLYAGTPAAYALRGQAFTFYSVHPELKGLVADSGRFFRFVPDARKRGAKVEVRYGPCRETLAADQDKRFALLLVEMVEEGFDPGDRLTLEAVRLYLARLTPDGIVALHISNKYYRLEPVVERIARELGLVGRVWHDDSESRPGKTAASWLVLARSVDALGPLAGANVEQARAFGTRNEPLVHLLRKYGPEKNAMDAILAEWGGPEADRHLLTPSLMSIREGPQAAILYQYAIRLRDAGQGRATLGRMTDLVCGAMFRPLAFDLGAELRTDSHRPELPPADPPAKK